MSWRTGFTMFCEYWEIAKQKMPEDEFRHEFLKSLLTLFLDCDCDPCEFQHLVEHDAEIKKALDEVDPVL